MAVPSIGKVIVSPLVPAFSSILLKKKKKKTLVKADQEDLIQDTTNEVL